MINGDRVAEPRVKIYYLSPSGEWNERGTGNVEIRDAESDNKLVIIKEDNENESDDHIFLLESRISMDDIYQRQQGLLTSFPILLLTF